MQEGVNNALKHARADLIDVEVVEAKSNVTVTITDDGAGFDTAAVSDRSACWGCVSG